MNVVTKKVCLIGDFSVGKTSLFRRFISDTFSDQYLTTVGVKVETRTLELNENTQVKLVLWDIAGADKMSLIGQNYLRGAQGYILVADGTRPATVTTAKSLKEEVDSFLSNPPYVALINKADLTDEWAIEDTFFEENPEWQKSSALSGEGVEEAFLKLAQQLRGDS